MYSEQVADREIPVQSICIDDLLRREPVHLDNQIIERLIHHRTVLVTGAGGSIGSEICRQISRFQPKNLILLGHGENSIFHLHQSLQRELHTDGLSVELVPVIGDITNQRRMEQVFETYRPEVVFHAAAHKHVPMMEANAGEAIRNNVLGTRCIANLADRYDAHKFVMISTDKAVNPTSVMGASKHMGERYVCALSIGSSTQFVVTRFGNVLGSVGSVVPIFLDQISRGGPVTVTDRRMTRYFMSIPEASQLVLQAGAMGRGGEIFVLDMGDPVRIVDLAMDMIRLSGLPENSIKLQFTGARPGEKMYEELYFHDERHVATSHPKLKAARHREYAMRDVEQQIESLASVMDGPDHLVRKEFRRYIPEYQWVQADLSRYSGKIMKVHKHSLVLHGV